MQYARALARFIFLSLTIEAVRNIIELCNDYFTIKIQFDCAIIKSMYNNFSFDSQLRTHICDYIQVMNNKR